MRVHEDYKEGWNVADQIDKPDSVFTFWQKMLQLRKKYEALVYGQSSPSGRDNV
jgi:glycosidase